MADTAGIRTINLSLDDSSMPIEVLVHVDAGGGQRGLRRQSLGIFISALLSLVGASDLDVTRILGVLTARGFTVDANGRLHLTQAEADILSAITQIGFRPNPSVLNLDRRTMFAARVGRAAAAAGIRRSRWLVVDDSTSRGVGDSGTGAWIYHLGRMMRAAGYPVTMNGFLGQGGNVSATFDPRYVFGNGWSGTNTPTVGGYLFVGFAGGTGAFSYTPQERVNTFEIIFTANASTGSVLVQIDDDPPVTVNTARASGDQVFTQTFTTTTLGFHSIRLYGVSGSAVYLVGMNAYDRNVTAIDIFNSGWSGSKASDWVVNQSPWSPLNLISQLGADQIIVGLGINDAGAIDNGQLTAATYQSQIQTIAQAAGASASVLLKTAIPSNPSAVSVASMTAVAAAQYNVARALGVPLVDIQYMMGGPNGFGLNSQFGIMFDALHGNGACYWDEARNVFAAAGL